MSDKSKINNMYQISTLQALMLGYTSGAITVGELAEHGDIGLGTFADVNGEMIVLDHHIYKANNKGEVTEADPKEGVPFASVAKVNSGIEFEIGETTNIDALKEILNNAIEEDFGLNSMYAVRLDGIFRQVKARAEAGKHTQHIPLSEILKDNQREFVFEEVAGTIVCMYYPDYMDRINAAGWHLHFISDDRKWGGHVFDLSFAKIKAIRYKINNLLMQLPMDAAFDTYSLNAVNENEVKKVEQSKG